MRRFFALSGAFVCGLVAAAAATASPPTRTPAPSADTIISGACSFDVGSHFTSQKEYAITFGDGSFIITGQFKVELTNEASGAVMSFNIPGPGRYTVSNAGVLTIQLEGPWLLFWGAGQMRGSTSGGFLYTTGRGVFTVYPDNTVTLTHDSGTTTDVCKALGG
jgi:hypothetical protein